MTRDVVLLFVFSIFPVLWGVIYTDCSMFEDEMLYGTVIYEQAIDANLTTFPSNYILRFQCDAGYQLTEPRFVFCSGENWTDHFPQCLKLNCPKPPALKKAQLQIRKGTLINPAIGSEIEYLCSSGYELKVPSDNILTCALKNNTATWTGNLSRCIGKKTCPDPEVPPDGSRSGNCCFTGNTVRYSCKNGYELVGDESIKCLPGGKWNNTRPRCRPKYDFCPDPPEIKHGQVIGEKHGDYYAFFDEVEIVCDDGYAFYGENRFVFCEEESNWDVEFGECRETFCPRPEIPSNGTIVELEYTDAVNFTEKFKIAYECDDGFRLVGNSDRTCTKGKWSGKETYCEEIRCYDPNIPENGMRNGDDFRIGGKVVFSCFSGYELIGSVERYCKPNGQWSGETARCNMASNHCANPGVPINGKKNGSHYGEGDKVEFSCYPGFTLVGPKIRECLKNRTWSGHEPKCLGAFDFDEKHHVGEILKEAIEEKAQKQAEELERFEQSLNKMQRTAATQRTLNLASPRRLILYFIFDVSGSVGLKNFKKSIRFAQALVKKVKVSEDGARVAAFTFSSKAEEEFLPGSYSTTEEVLDHLEKLEYKSGGTATNSALTLVEQTTHLVAATLGYNTKSVVFILTDGKANMGGNPKGQAEALKKAEVEIYCIGITGSIKKNGLYDLASDPVDKHVFILNDYKVMDWLIQDITNGTIDYSQCGLGLEKVKKGQSARILGGEYVIDPWPWMVALYYKVPGTSHRSAKLKCGASIIGQQHILTAAHCLMEEGVKLSTSDIIIRLGLTNVTEEENLQEYEAEKFITHPQFDDETLDYDIAIIKLKHLIEYNAFVRPICLPKGQKSELYTPSSIAFATGWGYDKKVPIGDSGKYLKTVKNLKELRLPLQNRKTCVESLLNQQQTAERLTERMFCAGNGKGETDTCHGDSGGPLMQSQLDVDRNVYWTQIGIVSWGLGCGIRNTYGVYTHIQNLLPWINSGLKDQ